MARLDVGQKIRWLGNVFYLVGEDGGVLNNGVPVPIESVWRAPLKFNEPIHVFGSVFGIPTRSEETYLGIVRAPDEVALRVLSTYERGKIFNSFTLSAIGPEKREKAGQPAGRGN